jgi:hypothetical protein
VLLAPDWNQLFGFDQQQTVILSWLARDALASDHWYEVQLWLEEEDPTGYYWTKENWWDMGAEYYPGDYYWRVIIVQGQGDDVVGAVSPPSETRYFSWVPVGPAPTRPPPTNTPRPPPTNTPRPTNTPEPPPTNTPRPIPG